MVDAVAGLILVALVVYALTGGADFGGGVWQLFARSEAQRRLIEKAIAPVWEANHVWLIFVIVLLFSAFPPVFSALSIALHIPLTLLLLGIVMRGSAFVFQQYGPPGAPRRRWERVFAVASTVTPLFLGVCVGALSTGRIRVTDGVTTAGWFDHWISPLPFACGVLALVLFAFLAATYLTVEAVAADDAELADAFRRRALWAGGVSIPVAALTTFAVTHHADGFAARFFGGWWSLPLLLVTVAVAAGALVALWRRRFRLARLLAAAQVGGIVVGWALAQHPYAIPPDLTFAGAAAGPRVLALVLVASGVGMVVLAPSLYWLFRVFKTPSEKPQ